MNQEEIFKLLLQRLDSPDGQQQVVTVRETKTWPAYTMEALCREGLLAPTTPSSLYTCTNCNDEHDEEVMVIESPPGSEPRFYVQCPQVGRVQVNLEDLRQWRLRIEGLLNLTQSLMGFQEPYQEIVTSRAWRLGVSDFGGVNRDVVMLRGLTWNDGHLIQERIYNCSVPTISVVLTDETLSSVPCSLPLFRILRLSNGSFLLDHTNLELISASWNVLSKKPEIQSTTEFEHSDDYRWVCWRGKEFNFSKQRAKVVRMLHEAYRAGKPVLSWDQIHPRLDNYPDRMSDVFKKSPAWGTLLIEVGQGLYRLDL